MHRAVDAHVHLKSGEPASLLDVSFSARILHVDDITCIRPACPLQSETLQHLASFTHSLLVTVPPELHQASSIRSTSFSVACV